jgi:threonine/homoserine/homoserine lactone efflux protein
VTLLIVRSVLRGGRAVVVAAPAQPTTPIAAAAALLVGVGLGTLSWYRGFSTAVALFRKQVSRRLLRLIDLATGSGLIAFGGLLGYRTLHQHEG